ECLILQILTGLFLAIHYTSDTATSFSSVAHICRDSIYILHLPIHPCRARSLLWILQLPRNMKYRNYPTIHCKSHSIHRLRPTMRQNILLRNNRHYKSSLSHPLHQQQSTLVIVHLLSLHETGSNYSSGIPSDIDKSLVPPLLQKDFLGCLLLVLVPLILVLFSPDLLGDPDNYTPANPLSTPPHIKQA
ncbi:hypothetical protein HPG69_009658, partial [Diceros bicornis minor]